MVKMINLYTGSVMYITKDRVQEYMNAGHKIAAPAAPEKPVTKTTRKRTVKK